MYIISKFLGNVEEEKSVHGICLIDDSKIVISKYALPNSTSVVKKNLEKFQIWPVPL